MEFDKIQKTLKPILLPLSFGYSHLMQVRTFLYKKGYFSSWRPPVFSISVGNIRVGGTGKTSLCIWLIDWLVKMGFNPVLLTRGYGSRPPILPFCVKKESDVRHCGDEPLMVMLKCENAAVMVDPDRIRSGKWALKRLNSDLLVLDDGFQHLKIKRDLDLVLLSVKDLTKRDDFVLPMGRRREEWSSLQRADAFFLNVYPDELFSLKYKTKELSVFKVPLFTFYLNITSLVQVCSWQKLPLKELTGQKYVLISGLANPLKFRETANRFLKGECVKHFIFPDHHPFTRKDWFRIKEEMKTLEVVYAVCSLKDAVKLRRFADKYLYALDFEICFGPYLFSDKDFPAWLKQKLAFYNS